MSDPTDTHPPARVLRAFLEGRLDEPESAAVEAHIGACGLCCRALGDLPDDRDGFVARLRAVPSVGLIAPPAADVTERIGATERPRRVGGRPAVPGYEVLAEGGRGGMGVDRRELKLWDVPSGEEAILLHGTQSATHDPGVNPQVAWSPDGRRLAASNFDLSLSIWDAPPEEAGGALPR